MTKKVEEEAEEEVEEEAEEEVEEEAEEEQPDDKTQVTKVKSATLKVEKVENTKWLKSKLAAMDAQIQELKEQLTAQQAQKLKSNTRRKFLRRKAR